MKETNALLKNLDQLIAQAPDERQVPETESTFPSSDAMRDNLRKSGFPKRHIEKLDKMTGRGLQEADRLSGKVTSGDCLLVLCGDRGPGKTQMATLWASRVKTSQYFRAHDLMEAIRGKFSDLKELENESFETLKKAKRKKLLVIDEFSELSGTDFERKTLTSLIDYRYGEKLTTIIITNTHPSLAPDEVGRSIWSRAEETGGILNCDWPSYRKS